MIYNLGRVVPLFKGNYDAATTYGFLDVVFYDNSSFVALDTTTGNLPTDTSHWLPVALKGTTQDPTPAQMQEITSAVEEYMHGTDFVYDADYVHIDVIDNHTSTSTTNALSANQGKVLYDVIEDATHTLYDKINLLRRNVDSLNELTYSFTDITYTSRIAEIYRTDGTTYTYTSSLYKTYIYQIEDDSLLYKADFKTVRNSIPQLVEGVSVAYLNSEMVLIGWEYKATSEPSDYMYDITLNVPQGTVYIALYGGSGTVANTHSRLQAGTQITSILSEDDVIDNLTSESTTDALSANQGKVLKESIDDVQDSVDDVQDSVDSLNNELYVKDDLTYSSRIAEIYRTDGTTYTYTSSLYKTYIYQIEDDSLHYIADFKTIKNSISQLNEGVSVAYLNDSMTLIGWEYKATSEPSDYMYDVPLNVPQGTVYIALYGGSGSVANTHSRLQAGIPISEYIKNVESKIELETNTAYYKDCEIINTESGGLKTNGNLDTGQSGTVYTFEVNPKQKYQFDVKLVDASVSDGASICYYDEDGVFISYEIPHKVSNNDERKSVYTYIPTIPQNAKTVKLFNGNSQIANIGCSCRVYPNTSVLYGKKICVLGDSISTNGSYTTPYIRITPSMVGTQIESYITLIDVNNGTTVGGTTLTNDMIDGTKHTFTPTSNDIGKSLGVPKIYSSNNTIPTWDKVLAKLTGATVVSNASFSGSSITTSSEYRTQYDYVGTAAWKEYSLSRCRDYKAWDYDNLETPDIIIIYRGTNDFSYTDNNTTTAMHMNLSDYNLLNGFDYNISDDYINNQFEFKMAYYSTINKLRDLYPQALIVCATLNVFRRVIYTTFPTRNYSYTLFDYNNAIRDIANTMGCPLIELDKDGITWQNCYSEGYITDSSSQPTHPNKKGHWAMGLKGASDLNYYLSKNWGVI